MVGALVVVAVLFFAARKGKEYVDRVEEDPGMAMAEVVALANPELEIVEKHPEEGRVTVRNTRTGEVTTVDVSRLQEGKIEWETEGRRSSVGIDRDSGTARVETEDDAGKRSSRQWGAGSEKIPAWVPRYPGATPEGIYRRTGPEGESGAFAVAVEDSVDEVIDHYRTTLEGRGYEVTENVFSGPDGKGGMIVGERDEEGRTVSLMISSEPDGTQVAVSYQVRADG